MKSEQDELRPEIKALQNQLADAERSRKAAVESNKKNQKAVSGLTLQLNEVGCPPLVKVVFGCCA